MSYHWGSFEKFLSHFWVTLDVTKIYFSKWPWLSWLVTHGNKSAYIRFTFINWKLWQRKCYVHHYHLVVRELDISYRWVSFCKFVRLIFASHWMSRKFAMIFYNYQLMDTCIHFNFHRYQYIHIWVRYLYMYTHELILCI